MLSCHVFRSSHFSFLVTFGDEVTKMLCNLCLHFARQDGQDRKNQKMKIWDERNKTNKKHT